MSFQDKQLKSDSSKRTEAEILADHKKKEREKAKQGKQPFFIKKCTVLSLSLSLVLLVNSSQMHEKQNVSEISTLESSYKELHP